MKIALSLLLILFSCNSTLESIDPGGSTSPDPGELGSGANFMSFGGSHLSIDSHENLIFAAASSSGLKIYDVSKAQDIKYVHAIDTEGLAWDLKYKDGHLYVAEGNAGFVVYKVLDNTLLKVSSVSLSDVRSIRIIGDTAYLADFSFGLRTYDISNPLNPVALSTYSNGSDVLSVEVKGNLALLSQGANGVDLVDLSTSTSLSTLSGVDAYSAVFDSDHVYVADGNDGVAVINISNTSSISLVHSLDTLGLARHIHLKDNHLFVSDSESGVVIIDKSDPLNLVKVSDSDFNGTDPSLRNAAMSSLVLGERLFLAGAGNGLVEISINDINNPVFHGHYGSTEDASNILLHGDYAFIADYGAGTVIVDISDPKEPKWVTSIIPTHGPHDTNLIMEDGKHLLIADRGSVIVVNIEDIRNPKIIHRILGFTDTLDIAMKDNFLVVSGIFVGNTGFHVLDMTNPTSPAYVTSISQVSKRTKLVFDGDHLFVANYISGLEIYNFSDPHNPVLRGAIDPAGTLRNMTVKDSFAYLAYTGVDKVEVVDITDLDNPLVDNTILTSGGNFGVHALGDRLYAGGGSTGLDIINISNPNAPSIISTYTKSGGPHYHYHSRVKNNHLFIAGGNGGLLIADIENESLPVDIIE